MFNCLVWADSAPGSGGSGGCGSDRFRYARCQEVRTAYPLCRAAKVCKMAADMVL